MTDWREDLKAYIDGELPLERRRELEEALASDANLRAELAAIEAISDAIRSQVVQPIPVGLERTLKAVAKLNSRPSFALRYAWVFAMGVSVLFFIIFFPLLQPDRSVAKRMKESAPEGVAVSSTPASANAMAEEAFKDKSAEGTVSRHAQKREEEAKGKRPESESASRSRMQQPQRQTGQPAQSAHVPESPVEGSGPPESLKFVPAFAILIFLIWWLGNRRPRR